MCTRNTGVNAESSPCVRGILVIVIPGTRYQIPGSYFIIIHYMLSTAVDLSGCPRQKSEVFGSELRWCPP